MVLGTTVAVAEPESSNDTIVYSAAFDNDTIVNFNDGTAAVGGDILDFKGIGGAAAGGVFGVVNNTHRSIVIETQTAANDTAAEVAALFTDAGAVITTAVTHVYVAVDADNIGHVYRVDDPVGATANVTATLMGTIDLADTPWSAVTLADNFA
jgi:hypothetical protein